MTRASIAIFPRTIDYTDNRTKPEVPDELFKIAQKLVEEKQGCELVRDKTGLYIVMYSESGPGKKREGWENWLPIYVAKVQSWSSGGIKESELANYLKEQEKRNEES